MSYTVAFVLGSGSWAPKGLLLARSLSTFTDCEQFIYMPADEAPMIPEAIREECRSHGRLYEAPAVHPEYPIATKLQAFERAGDIADTDHVVLLDTDTLVLAPLDQGRLGASELCVRPANFASRRWETGMGELLDPALFDQFGYELPSRTVAGEVDGKPMAACWNAGVVSTTDQTLPEEWLALARRVYDAMDDRPAEHRRFSDQLALAMLATDRETTLLPAADNFPAAFRLQFPPEIRILHYHGFQHLSRVRHSAIRQKLDRIGFSTVRKQHVEEPIYKPGVKHIGTNIVHRLVGW